MQTAITSASPAASRRGAGSRSDDLDPPSRRPALAADGRPRRATARSRAAASRNRGPSPEAAAIAVAARVDGNPGAACRPRRDGAARSRRAARALRARRGVKARPQQNRPWRRRPAATPAAGSRTGPQDRRSRQRQEPILAATMRAATSDDARAADATRRPHLGTPASPARPPPPTPRPARRLPRPAQARPLRPGRHRHDVGRRTMADGPSMSRELRGEERRLRAAGMDWPLQGLTMVGLEPARRPPACVESVVADGVPGDLIEAGTWRGGASILMRATLDALRATERTVWRRRLVPGLSPADVDSGSRPERRLDFLAVPPGGGPRSFARLGLEAGVEFVPGFFEETLPGLAGERWAVVRLDGDTYEATRLALECALPRLSVGGYLIVDDYGAIERMPQRGRGVPQRSTASPSRSRRSTGPARAGGARAHAPAATAPGAPGLRPAASAPRQSTGRPRPRCRRPERRGATSSSQSSACGRRGPSWSAARAPLRARAAATATGPSNG